MNIYVINLEKRKDRWEKIKNKFEGFNLIRIDGIETLSNGSIGCFKSHQKCIEIAKTNILPNVLVFEDDCEILNLDLIDFISLVHKLNEFLSNLKNWNIFFGAGNKIKSEDIVSKISHEQFTYTDSKEKLFQIYETKFLKTTHFVWYNHSVYDWILNLDPVTSYPIDKVWHGKFNCLVIIPFISTQSSDYSNIENKDCSYTDSIKRYERRLISNLKKINLPNYV